ncbi:hypothetical protein T05_1179 [Trichinella murrelli]|uniref:Uncharacterized protein n=1 Tax=Trichinella murrelli TaxID=144512 RepID=A0A0V0T6D1_9BILA|nr:hypothetical protein T05_1179 [Trichinella murrelli]
MDHHTSPSQRKKLSLSCISEKDIVHANDEIQTLKSEEKETGELSMCFSGIKEVNEIHTLLNEMEECSKSFQQLAESEKESAHHVSNDFISISEEIPNGNSFFTYEENFKMKKQKNPFPKHQHMEKQPLRAFLKKVIYQKLENTSQIQKI